MGVLSRWLNWKETSLDSALNAALQALVGYPESKSGPAVTAQSALQVTTVLRCVNVLANGVAQVPLKVYRARTGEIGSDVADAHPLHRVLHRRPNPWQTSFQFRRTLVFHVALTGDFFAFINRVNGEIRELIPLEPGRVEVIRHRDLTITYRVTGENGSRQDFPQSMIWHVAGPSWSSWKGLDPVRLAREAIGLSLATESAHADLHRNGVQSTGLYSVDGNLDGPQYRQLQEWIAAQIGGSNRFKPFVLDRGAKFTPNAMTGVDAQHLETRKHQIEEICRAFGVFPQMVGHAGDSAPTFASAEQFFIAHVVHTLGPWYEDLQQSADVNLLDERSDRDRGHFVKFTPTALLRGDMKAESDYLARALGAGGSPAWMEVNEVRALKDMNPVEWGNGKPEPPTTKPAQPASEPGK